MRRSRILIHLLVATVATAALALVATGAARAAEPAYASCGNTTSQGLLIDDVHARRTTCKNARSIARAVPAACSGKTSCNVRGYTCFSGRVGSELFLARCSKPRGNAELYHVIRFDYGS